VFISSVSNLYLFDLPYAIFLTPELSVFGSKAEMRFLPAARNRRRQSYQQYDAAQTGFIQCNSPHSRILPRFQK
jgi:hypothetical protein